MILHASIPADDPERVARVIASLWGGEAEAVAFPPVPGSWMAYAHDGRGSEIEISPRRLGFVPGPDEVGYVDQPETPRHSAAHLLIASPLGVDAVLEIGRRAGWVTRVCRRGGPGENGFDLIELWLENAFMLEVAPPEWQARYTDFVTSAATREMFGLRAAARETSSPCAAAREMSNPRAAA